MPMIALLVVLLLVWAVLVVIGVAVKTLFWLAALGLVLFVVTVVGAVLLRRGN
jgi:hypothetical protein